MEKNNYQRTFSVRIIDAERAANLRSVSTVLTLTKTQFEAHRQTTRSRLAKSFPFGCYNMLDNKTVYCTADVEVDGGLRDAVIYRQGLLVSNEEFERMEKERKVWVLEVPDDIYKIA